MLGDTAREPGRRRWVAALLAAFAAVALTPGAEAATRVYYSAGTSRSVPTDLKSGAPTVTITSGVATFTVAQPNNVGVGDEISYGGGTLAYISGRLSATQYRVTNRLGAAPADIAGSTVNRIYRAFATLSAAEAGSGDGTHLGTTNLAGAGNYQLNWPCYNDGPMNDQVSVSGYTTGANNYIRVYTPVSANEVGASQRHTGKARTGFRLQPTSAVDNDSIRVFDRFVRIEGIEIDGSLSAAPNGAGGVSIETLGLSPVDHYISHNIIYETRNFTGIYTASMSAKVWNNVCHRCNNPTLGAVAMDQPGGTGYYYNNTVYDHAGHGINANAGTMIATNNVSMKPGGGFFDFNTGTGTLTQSRNVSSDATAAGAGSQVNKTGYATYFRNTTVGSEDLHIISTSAALWGGSGADLSADSNLPVTDDVDGGLRMAPDIGADEFGSCCVLSAAETPGSTVTVTGASQFEMVFNTLRGAGIDDFFDLAEDPTRTLDLAGRDSLSLWGLFHSSMEAPAAVLYTTGTNSSGAKLDLLETTATRVKVRQESFFQQVLPSTAILPGVKGIGDYSIYSQRLALRWNRRITAAVPDQDDHALEITVHREAAGVLNPMNLYSQSGSAFPALAGDDFVLAQREVAGSPGARTDFLGIQSSDWAAADSLTASITGSYFSWRDTTDNQALATGLDEKWNFLIYYKPTNLLDNTSLAVTTRSSDYRIPSAVSVGPGTQWQDAAENTSAAGDFFNESEAAYVFNLNPTTGLSFDLDGSGTTRYSPFFKIRQWRSLAAPQTITVEGATRTRGVAYNADVKPVARAHFAQSLRWHSTLEDSAAVSTTPDVGSPGFVVGLVAGDFVAARYGSGARLSAASQYVAFDTTDLDRARGAIEFWFQPSWNSTDSVWHDISGFYVDANNFWFLDKEADNAVHFRIQASGAYFETKVDSPNYSWRAGDWVHLRIEWDDSAPPATQLRLYINGVEPSNSDIGGDYVSSTLTVAGRYRFGNSEGDATFCSCAFDEIHVYGGSSPTPSSLAHGGLGASPSEYLGDAGRNFALAFAGVDATRRGEYFYAGADAKFHGLNMLLATSGVSAMASGTLVWQYWNGTGWADLEAVAGFGDTTNDLRKPGNLYWTADPAGWSPYSVNGGPDLYHVRAYLPTGASYSTAPVEYKITTDILLFQYCGDVTAAAQTFVFAAPATTAVKLQSFSAAAGDGFVRLEWRTASELDNLGFHVYRSLSEAGPWARLTPSLIPGLGSSAVGQQYSFVDAGLQNGTRYFYRLEDVDASSKATWHGPVSAVPSAGASVGVPVGEAEAGAGKTDAATSPSCPAWVVAAYGSMAGGSESAASLTCTRHGDPEAVWLGVVARDARSATVELRTGGFYALHERSGRVRVFVPGFDFPQDPEAPALPLRRALVEAVVGRRVQLGGVRALEPAAFPGLVPVSLGRAEMQVSYDGTVTAGRHAARELAPRHVSVELARLLPSAFLGETKSAVVEITPLRFDAQRGRLLLARRVLVKLLFTGRETRESGRGSLGRRQTARPPLALTGELLARLHTRSVGLHAISFERLFPGRTRGLPSSQLRLERQGEAVGVHLEPPGEVFGPGGVLYFHADAAAASTDFSPEAAWELRRVTSGVAMPLMSAAPAGADVTTLPTGRATFESNRFYQPGLLDAADPWLWEALASGATRVKSFSLAGARGAAGRTAGLEILLQGASESGSPVDHHVSVALNGVPAGEARFAGKQPWRMSLSVDASLLRDGANEITFTSVADTGVSSLVFLDRFALSYPQAPALAGGVFEGRFDEDGTAVVVGASGPVALVDVTAKPTRWLTGYATAGGALRFRVEAGHRYLVVSQEGLVAPRVAAVAPSSLRSTSNQADYLLIAPQAFLAAAQPLVARREAQGLRARAVAFEKIADEFGHGQPSAEAIRSFLAYAFQSWARPSLRYVLLLGDASYDPRNFTGTAQPAPLPALWTKTSYLWTVSDPLLGAVNGEDALPDLAIGRLPAATLEQAQALVDKLIAWEDSGQRLAGAALLVADNPDLAGDFDADVDDIARGPLAGRAVRTLKLSELGGAMRPAILEAMDSGLGLLSYVGHGGAAVWASENVWNSWDAASLQAQSQQPLLLTLNCLNGYFVAPSFESLAESLLKAEGRGAIAAFSPSGLSLDGPAHQYHRALMAELTGGRHARLGDAILAAQKAYAETGLMPELLSVYHLLGDPATRIDP